MGSRRLTGVTSVEHDRVHQALRPESTLLQNPWYRFGPYLAERAWGTVREDYSGDGDAWTSFPHDHARSRAYRWNEDGMAGICDEHQRLCLALALWNGRDPILKERMFGLGGPEGNHGEDAKEHWWYVDGTPSHAWLVWRYHYPQGPFPYEDLVHENAARGHDRPEYELLDTDAFEGGYWVVEVAYAKAGPDDILMQVRVENAGPAATTLHVLPTLWFRNTWSWDDGARPSIHLDGDALRTDHPTLGRHELRFAGTATPLFCENETNAPRIWGTAATTAYPKDGIGDHVVDGRATVNPANHGTKAALHYRLTVPAGGVAELRLRLRDEREPAAEDPLGRGFDAVIHARSGEADELHASLTPGDATPAEAAVMRQAFAGLVWSKCYYALDVARWLDGDAVGPRPPAARRQGRNHDWRTFAAADVLLMPDPWEYPWFAAWDLAFHCVAYAHLDPTFAKNQLILLLREWYMHPDGQLPAYEWSFGDVNAPVHAWAALRVYRLEATVLGGAGDLAFLERVFHKLLINFTWWVNRKDAAGDNLFEGGFLGLDNIGPFDRSAMPVGGRLEQSDATGWMAAYCLWMLEIAVLLAEHNPAYEDVATKFFEHFAAISTAMNEQGLWDDADGFFYDRLVTPDGEEVPLRVRSMVGLVPILASAVTHTSRTDRVTGFTRRARWFMQHHPERVGMGRVTTAEDGRVLLGVLGPERLGRVLQRMLDETEFLSPHGLRSLSRTHLEHPAIVEVEGVRGVVGYEPAESSSGLFGGNSNWRGPIWFPLNYLLIEALGRYHRFFGTDLQVEHPTGSGRYTDLAGVSHDLSRRLITLFLPDGEGRRPCNGGSDRLDHDPRWRDLVAFHEYFDGDTGAGLGAAHQTGWTGIVAHLITNRRHMPSRS
jgi:hypothetical protein